ncbi:hypothetical protein EDI_131490 [Entamoeba dispar SAW760]|uniref:Ras-GAP domain-containing protein n=1 Tax=Entamoeba dispar (strain ATCC PRA-260 / SAW760) TaxID=370354 RepID=B0E5B8_ENTDS|nr:uncharacterized protein EDI_131490 [Entamoeba dispar SAW760]EDR30282.1 hypothetical protein EDI_131490 [Entamoeba dispar SAW760]|eukprot:EDR30282.1 hypothetical protein EDI_131490 [Entamoeba dispar SAW760]
MSESINKYSKISTSGSKISRAFNGSSQNYSITIDSVSMTSKKSVEEKLRELLFRENSILLKSYCDNLLKKDPQTNQVFSLILFYSSRGKVTQLLCQVGRREIKEAKAGTPLFRGNTPFIRLYSYYLFFYCSDFMNKTTSEVMNETGLNKLSPVEYDDETWVEEFVRYYSLLIIQNANCIPCHQRKIIKSLLCSPSVKDDIIKKKQIFSTLMFLRYLFVPFLKHPYILKSLQKCVSEWIREGEEKDKKQGNTTDIFNELKLSLDHLYDNVVNSPVGFEVGMINLKQQEQSLNELMDILKDNLFTLSSDYSGDFQEIFNLVKGKQEVDTSTNMEFATDELKHWTGSKLEIASQLNCELKFKITELTRENERIKHKISFINNYFL